MDEALKAVSEATEAGRMLRLQEDREKVIKALEAVPEGET
jgi:hypothetical protein